MGGLVSIMSVSMIGQQYQLIIEEIRKKVADDDYIISDDLMKCMEDANEGYLSFAGNNDMHLGTHMEMEPMDKDKLLSVLQNYLDASSQQFIECKNMIMMMMNKQEGHSSSSNENWKGTTTFMLEFLYLEYSIVHNYQQSPDDTEYWKSVCSIFDTKIPPGTFN